MEKFNPNDIVVFDQNGLSVIQTDAITVEIKKDEATFLIRDFRNKWVQTLIVFLAGVLIGIAGCCVFG